MKTAVIVFPGSNCDRDMQVALRQSTGTEPLMVWHRDTEMPKVDMIAVPGGFSYGDYLRSGAIAANSPIMREVAALADKGVPVLGVCNGFQVLTETGLLPGALMRNANLKYVCRDVWLRVEQTDTRAMADKGADRFHGLGFNGYIEVGAVRRESLLRLCIDLMLRQQRYER